MKSYLIGVVWAVVIGTVVELLPPDEGKQTTVFRLLVSLLILCVIATPLLTVLQEGPDVLLDRIRSAIEEINIEGGALSDRYAEQTAAYIRTASEREAEESVGILLAERFGISAQDCRVDITLGGTAEEITLEQMTVVLSGRAVLTDPYTIEAYLSTLFGGAAVVAIE